MTVAEIEARLAAIASEIETRGAELTTDQLTAFQDEVTDLKEKRRALTSAGEQRQALLASIAEGRQGSVARTFPAPTPAPAGGQPQAEQREEIDPYNTLEYRRAFMDYACRGVPIPAELRANATTTTGDVSAVIPTTILQEIIKKVESYGEIYAKVRKLNVQGGVAVPVLTLKPTAKWIGEAKVSDTQKVKADDKVTFAYNGLECRIAQSLLASIVTLDVFQREFPQLAAEAMIKAIEICIFTGDGDGKMTGILMDDRVPEANKITITAEEMTKWDGWKKKVFAKMKKAYRTGEFIMAQGTFDGYIDGMVDKNGQPIGRINYGIEGEEKYRFGGKTVLTVEDECIKAYEDAAAGDVIAVFVKLDDYAINSNMQMTLVRWEDHDTNTIKDKCILICDGKLLDPNGVLIIKKG